MQRNRISSFVFSVVILSWSLASTATTITLLNDNFTNGEGSTLVAGGLLIGDAFAAGDVKGQWHSQNGNNNATGWFIGPGTGTLYNGVDTSDGNKAVALMLDLAAFSGVQNQLNLSFDSQGGTDEQLFVHLWGYVSNGDPEEGPGAWAGNLGAINGMWESTGTAYDQYNFGGVDGVFAAPAGTKTDAAVQGLLGTETSTSHSYSFDLSAFSSAPDQVFDYDYLVLGFQRTATGTTTTAFQIDNVLLTASVIPEPSSLLLLGLGMVSLLLRKRR